MKYYTKKAKEFIKKRPDRKESLFRMGINDFAKFLDEQEQEKRK